MTVPPTMNRKEVLQKKLELLRETHRELDSNIQVLELEPATDHIRLTKMKKRKLALKDEIARVEDDLTPDIIA